MMSQHLHGRVRLYKVKHYIELVIKAGGVSDAAIIPVCDSFALSSLHCENPATSV